MSSVSEPKILSGVELESERKFHTKEFSFVKVSLKDDGIEYVCPANLKENSDQPGSVQQSAVLFAP